MSVISNNEIKHVKSLAMKKFRDLTGLFTVEGEKMVAEALSSSFHVEKIYRKDEIGNDAMTRITNLSSPSPVLAVVRKPSDIKLETPEDISNSIADTGLYIGLDSIRDPGNLGTIIRIAEWFGAKGIFAAPDTVDIFNPKVVQATMGAIFRVPFHYCNLETVAGIMSGRGGKVYGTFLDGENIYESELETGLASPVMFITGNEASGISSSVERHVSGRLYIPPYPANDPGSESLNAAVATAVTIAEFRRRVR